MDYITARQPTKAQIVANGFVAFSAFIFLFTSVAFKGSYKLSGILIVLSYCCFLIKPLRQQVTLDEHSKKLIAVLLVYGLTFILELLMFNQDARELDQVSKIVLFLPLIPLLSGARIANSIIIAGLASGSFLLFVVAGYEAFYLEKWRAGGGINEIQFGGIAIVMGGCTLCFWAYFKQPILRGLVILAGLSAIIASGLSGSRGAWLAIIPILIILFTGFYTELSKRIKLTALSVILLAIAFIAFYPQSSIKDRVNTAVSQLERYNNNPGISNTSVGLRLDMWKIAAEVSLQNPIIGAGKEDYLAYQKKQVEQGKASPRLLNFSHAHNGYLDSSARRGLVGLSALLLLLLFPVYIGLKHWKSPSARIKSSALSLMIYGSSFATFTLTQSVLSHNSGMVMFTGMLIILMSILSSELKHNDQCNHHYQK